MYMYQEFIMREGKRVLSALYTHNCTMCNMFSGSNVKSRIVYMTKPRS